MAQESGSKRSKLGLDQRHHPGCVESLLHFAIFSGTWQERLHLKKMIAYRRHTDASRLTKIKVPKVKHCLVQEGSNLLVGECKLGSPGKCKSPTKSPTKSPIKDLLKPLKFKKKSSEKGHRRSLTSLPPPSASRLVRTMSIHHLKSCDYVLPVESSNSRETTNDSISNSSNEVQKTCQKCGTVAGLNLVEHFDQSKDLLDLLQFFKENKCLLMDMAHNHRTLMAKESIEKPASSDEGMGLNKSKTFPRPGTPQNKEGSSRKNSKSISSNIRNAIKENKKEVIHIANDGFLHKLPYGRKDCEGRKRNYRKEGGETQMRRSSSLNESLDKYSNLFEFISKEESKSTAFKRIHSMSEIKFYSAFVPPSVTASSRDATDTKSVHSLAEAEPLDSELSTDEVEPLDNESSIDEVEPLDNESNIDEVEPLDLECRTNQVEEVDPELHDNEGIYLKQFLSGSSLKYDNINSNETESQEGPINNLQIVDHHYNIEVDENDEAYFHYTKVLLGKSGLTGTDWYPYEQPVLDPASLELEPNSGPDQLLLFDLINEALLDAYEASLLSGTWVPRFGFANRPLHLGKYMLEEVWARLKRQLNSFVEVAIEDVVVADFCKEKDGWMNLNLDSEFVGLDLEDLIIEDLVGEIVLELINPSF